MTLDLPRKNLIKQILISYEIEEDTNMVVKKTHTAAPDIGWCRLY